MANNNILAGLSESDIPAKLRDRFSTEKYTLWITSLSDSALSQEYLLCIEENAAFTVTRLSHLPAAVFSTPISGGLSLAFHTATFSYTQLRGIVFEKDRKICEAEMNRRRLTKPSLSDRKAMKILGKGIIRVIHPLLRL